MPTESLAMGHSTTKKRLFFVRALIKLLRGLFCGKLLRGWPFRRENGPALAESLLRETAAKEGKRIPRHFLLLLKQLQSI